MLQMERVSQLYSVVKNFSLGSTKCSWNQCYIQERCAPTTTSASRTELSRRHCWRRGDTWCRSLLHLQNPTDNRHQTEAAVEQKVSEFKQVSLTSHLELKTQSFSDLCEQRCSCRTQVVRDYQLGVGVDPCWMELPQWLVEQKKNKRFNWYWFVLMIPSWNISF